MRSKLHNFVKEFIVPTAQEVEDKSTGIVKWGKDNLFPQWLNYLYYSSAVHQGIIRGKVFFTVSQGFSISNETTKKFEGIISDMANSLEVSDSYYLLMTRSVTDATKIVGVKYVPFEWVRVGTDGCFYVSEDWTDKTIAIKKYFGKDSDERMFMYQFKVSPMQIQYGGRGRKLSFNYYPQVPYSGSVKSIMTDVEIANYQL
jgi:hypothetical protein